MYLYNIQYIPELNIGQVFYYICSNVSPILLKYCKVQESGSMTEKESKENYYQVLQYFFYYSITNILSVL